MYFSDVGELESHLNNDWTIIFKNIKIMEDCHFQLLQYNKKVQNRQRSQDDDPFIKDQILHHQQQIARVHQALNEMTQEETQIIAKYEDSIVSHEEIVKLMGRVGVRLLETYQSSIDQSKTFDDDLMDKHLKMRASLVKILNAKDKINLPEIISLVINYSKTKLLNQAERLKKMVQSLQNGDYQKAHGQYFFKKKDTSMSPEKKMPVSSNSTEKKNISQEKIKVSSVGRQDRSPVWEELKTQEKLRKQRQKVALRLVHGLYSMLDLARQQMIQDMCSNERDKSKRLFNEIFSRNKFNHEQIIAFEAKKDEFHLKIQAFKEFMQKQSKKIAQALRKSSGKRQKRKVDNLNFSKIEIQPTQEEEKLLQSQITSSRKSSRYRIQSPKAKGKLNEHPMIIQCSQENFNHIKFQDNQNQSTYIRPNRNKLPFLYSQNVSQCINRASSYDQRSELNRTKPLRHQISDYKVQREDILNHEAMIRNEKAKKEEKYMSQRTKVPLKNIQVRVGGVMRLQEEGHRNVKPNPMQYTFYVRRSNRFYQPNHNIIF